MLTLREFITKINFYEHYRVYQPNRDCLIFESYFKVHSEYYFDKEHENTGEWFNKNYFDNNDYCDDVYHVNKYDNETKIFLDKFGDYEVFLIEIGSFTPSRIHKNKNGSIKIKYLKDKNRPNEDNLPCFDLFIKSQEKYSPEEYLQIVDNFDGDSFDLETLE